MNVLAANSLTFLSFPELKRENPSFVWAIALSLFLHGLALGWLPGLKQIDSIVKEPLSVLLPLPPVQENQEIAVPPVPTFDRKLPHQASPKASGSESVRETLPILASTPTDISNTIPSLAEPESLVAPAPPTESVPAAVTPAPRSVTPDPQALTAYGKHLAGAVAAHQRYPRLALMRQWQGTTLLQLQLDRHGSLTDVRIINSSGHEILDKQAIEMVRSALPFPPLPDNLSGRVLTVDVPVVFRLAS